jgi:hypothetical protein
MKTLNIKILFTILIFAFIDYIYAQQLPAISYGTICFYVRYPGGWNASTCYYYDGKVEGQHTSGGKMPFMYMVEDTAPRFFIDTLFKLGLETVKNYPAFDISEHKKPSYTIHLHFLYTDSTQQGFRYTTSLCRGFNEIPLQKLAALIDLNQRIYEHDSTSKWRIDYSICERDSNEIHKCEEMQKCKDSFDKEKPETEMENPDSIKRSNEEELQKLKLQLERYNQQDSVK